MTVAYTITYNGRYLEIISVGRKSIARSRKMYQEVVKLSERHQCFDILGVSLSEEPMNISDAFDHAEMFVELGIGNQYRIAWVETNPDAMEPLEFAEDVLYNRGLPGQLFDNLEAARNWLVGDSSRGLPGRAFDSVEEARRCLPDQS